MTTQPGRITTPAQSVGVAPRCASRADRAPGRHASAPPRTPSAPDALARVDQGSSRSPRPRVLRSGTEPSGDGGAAEGGHDPERAARDGPAPTRSVRWPPASRCSTPTVARLARPRPRSAPAGRSSSVPLRGRSVSSSWSRATPRERSALDGAGGDRRGRSAVCSTDRSSTCRRTTTLRCISGSGCRAVISSSRSSTSPVPASRGRSTSSPTTSCRAEARLTLSRRLVTRIRRT